MNFVHHLLKSLFFAHAVAVYAQYIDLVTSSAKQVFQYFLSTLGALSDRTQFRAVAVWAGVGNPLLVVAVVTMQMQGRGAGSGWHRSSDTPAASRTRYR